MTRCYVDTSALMKLYLPEPDSARFRAHLAAASALLICDWASLEVRAAFLGLVRRGVMTAAQAATGLNGFTADLGNYDIIPISREAYRSGGTLLDRYLVSHGLRTADALHIAVASTERHSAGVEEFATADQVQAAVAAMEGFTVWP